MIKPLGIPLYFDTSSAMRIILPEGLEPGATRVQAEILRLGEVEYVSSALTRIEMFSALRSKQRGRILSNTQTDRLKRKWVEFSDEFLFYWPISDEVLYSAQNLLKTSKVEGRLRSLDCIHFATFFECSKHFSNTILFSTDTVMCSLAQEHNLPFFNPLQPE